MSTDYCNSSNVIAFPARRPTGLSEVDILHGTLTTLLDRVSDLDRIDQDTARYLAVILRTMAAWVEEHDRP